MSETVNFETFCALAKSGCRIIVEIGSHAILQRYMRDTRVSLDVKGRVLTTQQNVQYRNTGILLTVTPHINDKGLVRMEVSQEVSELSDRVVEGISSPVFNKRKAETVLAVKDGQTIVIGGLISQSKADNYSGVPVLSRVPILKNLVGVQSKGWVNTELMLFITPHVVVHNDDADFISRRFLDRVEFVKRGMH